MSEPKYNNHTCHWPGCKTFVHPIHWGCAHHWKQVPQHYKDGLIKHYRKGQEIDKDPSQAYIDVLLELDQWCRDQNALEGACS